ncbi:MAG: hypothetical protein HOI23_07600 [Deltaproteobacteria bacterium]|nr:hypothetical protein [Deltaproteobacteria bacterium]MBT6432149.1 hypothetical protein [Deltaproteobacteria bacterium]MBT6490113.1 hypothetical protein [Deltaproteobacteria bacterium]
MNSRRLFFGIFLILNIGLGSCSDDGETDNFPICPAHSVGEGPVCVCDAGYFGTINWSEQNETYSGECITALEMALRTGDVRYLEEVGTALASAIDSLDASRAASQSILRTIYESEPIDYVPTEWSQFVLTGNLTNNFSLVSGSLQGRPLALAGSNEMTRYAAYGSNPFQVALSDSPSYSGALKRLLLWLSGGEGGAMAPTQTTLALVKLGGEEASVLSWLDAQPESMNWTVLSCDAAEELSACSETADVVIIGDAFPSDEIDTVSRFVELATAEGKSFLYSHTAAWEDTPAGRTILSHFDMRFGEYGGNYFVEDLAAWSNVENMLEDGGLSGDIERVLTHLALSDYSFDWSGCTEWVGQTSCGEVSGLRREFLNGAQMVKAYFNGIDEVGELVFDENAERFWKLIALIGDWFRLSIEYPMDKNQTEDSVFLAAYFADHSVLYNRSVNVAQSDLGTFSKVLSTQDVEVGTYTVSVPVSRDGGFTAIGLYALPGVTFNIERMDTNSLHAAVKINTQRTGSTREFDANNYTRPKFLQSAAFDLVKGEALTLTSPYGGTLQVVTPITQEDLSIELKVTQVTKHAVLESSSEYAAYYENLSSSVLDFTEIKTPYIQIHSRTDMMLEAINQEPYSGNLELFFNHLEHYMIQDTYNLAGFVGDILEHNDAITSFCADYSWDCTSVDIHASPAIQHINIDTYAHCGGGCSGNPYDQSWVLGPLGWGETHEIGHNLQRSRINIYGGRTSEVSNQIFPLHKGFQYKLDTGTASPTNDVGYRQTFDWIQEAQLTEDPTQYVYDRLWDGDGVYDQNSERMAFFMEVIHCNEDVMSPRGGNGWDVFTAMYLLERLFTHAVNTDSWPAYKSSLGFSTYSTAPQSIDSNDFMLVALSFVTQKDQRRFFDMWGITYTSKASSQVASFGFPEAEMIFYANDNSSNMPHPEPVPMDGSSAWPL